MTKIVGRYIAIGTLACFVGLLVFLIRLFVNAGDSVVQPLAFNHKVHTENASLGCKDCHVNVETMAVASIPALEICQNCHSGEPISKSPVEKELLQHTAQKKEIPWVQIYSVPEQVYFSHRRHVAIGELECSTCHGDVAAMTTPVSSPAIPVTMNNCMNCHRQHKVTNDCLACHR